MAETGVSTTRGYGFEFTVLGFESRVSSSKFKVQSSSVHDSLFTIYYVLLTAFCSPFFQSLNLIAQFRGTLEFQVFRGSSHFLFELDKEILPLIFGQIFHNAI